MASGVVAVTCASDGVLIASPVVVAWIGAAAWAFLIAGRASGAVVTSARSICLAFAVAIAWVGGTTRTFVGAGGTPVACEACACSVDTRALSVAHKANAVDGCHCAGEGAVCSGPSDFADALASIGDAGTIAIAGIGTIGVCCGAGAGTTETPEPFRTSESRIEAVLVVQVACWATDVVVAITSDGATGATNAVPADTSVVANGACFIGALGGASVVTDVGWSTIGAGGAFPESVSAVGVAHTNTIGLPAGAVVVTWIGGASWADACTGGTPVSSAAQTNSGAVNTGITVAIAAAWAVQ